jgi:3-hydroxyisobutyrate dehydrogenase-like beta-hydroxyacid dehydrogenase
MALTIGIISAGAMGSALGARLNSQGLRVLTSLEGRSGASRSRAKAAGMLDASDDQIMEEASVIFSIVPPAQAIIVAQRFCTKFSNKSVGKLYVDCNAISVAKIIEIEQLFSTTGVCFADGGIIGPPPRKDEEGPRLYISGVLSSDASNWLKQIKQSGVDIRFLEGPVGTSSALKLSYAGITKGITALGACMILAAERAGSGKFLKEELLASQPQIMTRLSKSLPEMYSKAYRWVDEMESISEFIGDTFPENNIFVGAAALFERISNDFSGGGDECAVMDKFLERPDTNS